MTAVCAAFLGWWARRKCAFAHPTTEAALVQKKLSPRALVTAGVILLTGRPTLLRACELASLGKLVTFDFAGALPIGNFSRPLRVVSEGGAAAQTGYNDQTKNKRLH
jgi:hypothetical protein